MLTVVDSPPPDGGASVFRPPYVGDDKPYYATADIHTDRLPSLATVADAPSLDWVVERFKRVQLQHEFGRMGRIIRPEDNLDSYGPDNAADEPEVVRAW